MDKKSDGLSTMLWISAFVPYDKVDHAGGQIHNYYLKGLMKNGNYDIKLLTFAKASEVPLIDLDKYGINYEIVGLYAERSTVFKFIISKTYEKIVKWNILDKYAGFVKPVIRNGVKKALKKLAKAGYYPNYILLQWTQIVLLKDEVSKYFPNAKIIAIEEDVAFQLYYRKYVNDRVWVRRFLQKIQYNHLKKLEIFALSKSSLVIVNNQKDRALLLENKVSTPIFVTIPFYHSYEHVPYLGDKKTIIMYGAMNRVENYSSVIWFVNNVWERLKSDELELLIIGANPNNKLLKLQSQRVRVLGYVENVSDYMKHGLCMVAPLLTGAGIKIKILEAMSAGIPVLTNDIGIEGINAENGKNFLYCCTPDDYVRTINDISRGVIDSKTISANAKQFIKENFDMNNIIEKMDYKIRKI